MTEKGRQPVSGLQYRGHAAKPRNSSTHVVHITGYKRRKIKLDLYARVGNGLFLADGVITQ